MHVPDSSMHGIPATSATREEKEKASDLAHMGEMSDQSQSKRR
jgi:hypothetical protein